MNESLAEVRFGAWNLASVHLCLDSGRIDEARRLAAVVVDSH